jgi:hypothetical protein
VDSKLNFFLFSYAFIDPKKFIPDPGGKKALDPDLQHWAFLSLENEPLNFLTLCGKAGGLSCF